VTQPSVFEWGQCHQHWHFKCFARSQLLALDGVTTVVSGTKLAFCMDDSYQYILGPNINANPVTDCVTQGMSPGWADSYTPDLDCQWLDITSVARNAWYIFEQCTNPCRYFMELTYDNNCQRVLVYLPATISNSSTVQYTSITLPSPAPSCPSCS